MYLCIEIYKIQRENIYATIKRLLDSDGLNWICNQISYNRFTNLGELIQGYLESKPRKGLSLKDFVNIKCNQKMTMKVNCTHATLW